MSRAAGRAFTFSTTLRQTPRSLYWIAIPAKVSQAIGRRGPVPVVSTINGTTEFRASIVPIGEGRHRLQINARVRAEAGIAPRDRVEVALRVDDDPVSEPAPPDLADALRESGATAAFERFPAGKRRHVIAWIEEAVGDRTRERRVAKAVEVALEKAESDADREGSQPRSPARRRS